MANAGLELMVSHLLAQTGSLLMKEELPQRQKQWSSLVFSFSSWERALKMGGGLKFAPQLQLLQAEQEGLKAAQGQGPPRQVCKCSLREEAAS